MAGSTLTISPDIRETPHAVRYEFALSHSGRSRTETLFYEFPRQLAPPPPETFDGALCAILFHAMAERCDIRLRGAATETLLRNLSEFQLAWARWLREIYRPVEIAVDRVVSRPSARPARSIAAFSGGVDSLFSTVRHTIDGAPTRYPLDTVLIVHGFDVALTNATALEELVERTEGVRQVCGVDLRTVRTNSKELRLQEWRYSHGAELAACLHFFSAEFSHALIGSSEPYDAMVLPWGSNPVTDHLLSGGHLRIVHDGAAFSRTDKVAFLARHPAILRGLKVCWQGKEQGRNCGVCEKCMRTRLNLLAVGVANPPCFDAPLDLPRISGIAIATDLALGELRSIVQYAERRNIDGEWLDLLRQRVRRGRKNWTWRRQVRTSLARAGLLETARKLQRPFVARRMM